MRTVIDNIQLHYTTDGSEAGEPILLLHGWAADVRTWAPITPAFIEAGYRVFALDLPGHGLSPAPPSPWGIPEYAHFVQSFINKQQLSAVTLIGHSFGGRLSILLGSQPDVPLAKIILINSAGVRIEPSAFKKLVGQIGSSVSSMTKNTPLSRLVQPLRRQYYSLIGAEDYINADDDMRSTFVKVVSQDLQAEAAQISVPTLLIWGVDDQETPLWTGQRLHEKITESELITLDEVGHFAHIEQPSVVSQHILNFLGASSNAS